jgi:hypothetical protein
MYIRSLTAAVYDKYSYVLFSDIKTALLINYFCCL